MMSMKLREFTPERRPNPGKYADYHAYKDSLREDFHCRCGYCDDQDYFSDVPYQIDHFVPKAALKTIAENDYGNLVYSCRRCNRAKWDKWPTGDEYRHNDGKEGFIDPCNPSYDQQFERNDRGEIIPVTALGDWMWMEMDLGNPAHRIIWTLAHIRKELDCVRKLAGAAEDAKVKTLCNKYFDLEDQLRGVPRL